MTHDDRPPDFDQIARTFVASLDATWTVDRISAAVAEQLRLVWNARGAADRETIDALEARVADLDALLDDVPPGT